MCISDFGSLWDNFFGTISEVSKIKTTYQSKAKLSNPIFVFCVYYIFKEIIFLFFYNEPELGVGINSGVALTPLPSSIGREMNPRPSYREPYC